MLLELLQSTVKKLLIRSQRVVNKNDKSANSSGILNEQPTELIIEQESEIADFAINSSTRNALKNYNPSYPFSLNIELTTRCNAKCVFCVVSQREEGASGENMPFALLEKIAQEVSEWPRDLTGDIAPIGLGEPTLYPKFSEALKILREAAPPKFTFSLNTNGISLYKENIQQAIIDTVDDLIISMNGHTRETYYKLNGVDNFDRTVENIKSFLKAKGSRKPRTSIQLMRSNVTEYEAFQKFKEMWKAFLNSGDQVYYRPMSTFSFYDDFKDLLTPEDQERQTKIHNPCYQMWSVISIAYDGRIYPCCVAFSGEGETCRGTSSGLLLSSLVQENTSIKGIYQGQQLKRLRALHCDGKAENIPMCKGCHAPTHYGKDVWDNLLKNR